MLKGVAGLGAGSAGVFSSITDSGLTATRVVFSGTGGLLSDSANLTWSSPALSIGAAGVTGALKLLGLTSGTMTLVAPAVAGTTTITTPGATATLATLALVEALTNKTVNGMTITASTGTFTLTNGKTFAVTHGLTLSGTDSTVMTFPATTATIARTDAANTFAGTQTLSSLAGTGSRAVVADDNGVLSAP